jgi:bifunctional non-homologous end joining protein LigD
MPEQRQLEINGVQVGVSNLDKIFYPKTGFTKGQVIDYYVKISPVLLPHLHNRPITLKRYPNGVDGFFFYEKRCPPGRPKWIKTARVGKSAGGEVNYCLINDLPALVWAANLADLELHTFLHQAPDIQRPTALAFDLDPGPPADILSCCQVALRLKAIFEGLGLKSFPKTSGSKGMQVFVPLNGPMIYAKTKAFAHRLAELLEAKFPDLVVSRMEKARRKGKVFVDWSQNDDKKTTVSVYSLRAKEHPMVSTPLTWREIQSALGKGDAGSLAFESHEVLQRVKKKGDLFVPVLEMKQKLPAIQLLERFVY